MMFKRLIPAITLMLIFGVAILCGCTQSDDVIFNEGNTQYISINAYFSKSQDHSTFGIKSDTINPGDSIILMTSVYPQKSIRSKDYYWTMDGKFFAFEYNCQRAIHDPGYHQFNFVFVDYFGDTLVDTLNLYVGSIPVLDSQQFIPANSTQYVSPSEFLSFAWNVYDPDSMWDMSHHFILREAQGFYKKPKVLVDTILHESNFTYLKGFDHLRQYEWTVTVQNELQQKASESIHSTFSTRGIQGESAIFGFIDHSSSEKNIFCHLWLTNSEGYMVYDDTISSTKDEAFSVNSLRPGKYTLYTMAKDYPDFTIDTTVFEIVANHILTLDTIRLSDSIPPRIIGIGSLDGESIDYADTLKFLLKDYGGKIQDKRIKVTLETDNVSDFKFSNDTLFVTIPELKNSWTTRLLSISTYDYSGNKAKETFKILPSKTLPEVFSE